MGLIHHDQVPVAPLKFALYVLVTAQLVQPADGQRILQEPVAGSRRFQLVIRQNLKGQVKLEMEFVLPLISKHSGAHDEAAVQVTTGQEFFDQETGHDGLAGSGIVGQKKPQGLPWQHFPVHARDLMRQGLNERRVNGQDWVKKIRQSDAVGLRNEAQPRAIPIEAPRAADRNNLDSGFAITVKEFAP